jgi:type VI secretion system protein ImpA
MGESWTAGALTDPIADASPCGPPLDPSELLMFDGYRVFGQQLALDAPLETSEDGRESEHRRVPKPVDSPEWGEIRDRARAALARSKDLRVLALLGAALLRTDGPYAFCQTVVIAANWLVDFRDTVHPVAVEDSVERQSALSAFNDYFAVIDPLRRTPLTTSREHGRFALRDLEQTVPPVAAAAFDQIPLPELRSQWQRVGDALQAIGRIDAQIRQADPDPVLSLDDVSGQLLRLERILRSQLARRPESGVTAGVSSDATERLIDQRAAAAAATRVGDIRTREDAVRALDAVATFFRQTEPSSPVPLLLERAKRLVSKSFLEVLADLAPGALGEARTASGVREP